MCSVNNPSTHNSTDAVRNDSRCLEVFTQFSEGKESCWLGNWIFFEYEELRQEVSRKYQPNQDVSPGEIRSVLINVLIQKINDHSFGCGMVYELYEVRKQDTLEFILGSFFFSDLEATLIKEECYYSEAREVFRESCDDCGNNISALQLAHSLSMEGKALCAHCLTY